MVRDEFTNKKSHTGFRFVPKSATWNDVMNGVILRYFTEFGNCGSQLRRTSKKVRPTLSAIKYSTKIYSFWQYMIYGNIRRLLKMCA